MGQDQCRAKITRWVSSCARSPHTGFPDPLTAVGIPYVNLWNYEPVPSEMEPAFPVEQGAASAPGMRIDVSGSMAENLRL